MQQEVEEQLGGVQVALQDPVCFGSSRPCKNGSVCDTMCGEFPKLICACPCAQTNV